MYTTASHIPQVNAEHPDILHINNNASNYMYRAFSPITTTLATHVLCKLDSPVRKIQRRDWGANAIRQN